VQLGVAIEREPLLTEIAHGHWQGRYRGEIAASEPELYRTWREHPERVRFDGGESLNDVLERWKTFVARFEPRANTLLVTHDIMVRVALLDRTGRPMEELRTVRALNASYASFEVDGERWTLREECAADHLAELQADVERQAL
jgi:probable phosphoglycerate mutase